MHTNRLTVVSRQAKLWYVGVVLLQRRIKELQRAIQENGHKLEEVQQKRLWAEEEIIQR